MRALASSLLANAETRIVYRQESDQLGRHLSGPRAHRHRAVPHPHPGHRPGAVADQEPLVRCASIRCIRPSSNSSTRRPDDWRAGAMSTQVRSRPPGGQPRALQSSSTDAVSALVTGEDWKRALTFAAQFRRSFQQLDADRASPLRGVRRRPGAGADPDVRRRVQAVDHPRPSRDEGPARVRHPRPRHCPVRVRDPGRTRTRGDAWREARSPAGRDRALELVGLKPTHVWDVSQTDGDPIPELPAARPAAGQAPEGCGTASPTRSPRAATSFGSSRPPPRSAAPTG